MRYDEIVNAGMKVIEEAGIDKRWLNLGAETQSQNRLNREYTDSLMFEMRLLGSEFADTSTKLFGVKLPAPIMPAAFMRGRVWDKLSRSELWNKRSSFSFSVDYLEEVSAGVTEAESMMWLGVHEETNVLPHMIDAGAKVALIVKPIKDKEKARQIVRWGEKLGCVAVGVDIDAMFGEKSFDEVEGPPNLGPQTIDDLKSYREATSLPFIIKGVLSVLDAKTSKDEIGADCIVVSTHGGEAIDYAVPILKILPEIRQAVGKDMRIIVDTGFRRGTDVLKALALGADGACFGTLLVIAFAAYGRDGVANMLRVLYRELQRAMTLTGCKSVVDIDTTIIRYP
jgi:4-hydroxymandelate oxidase